MSILNNKPRSAGATIAEDAKLLVIDPRTFEAMLRGVGSLAAAGHGESFRGHPELPGLSVAGHV